MVLRRLSPMEAAPLLFLLLHLHLLCPSSSLAIQEDEDPSLPLIDRHETQLRRLESLVDSLSSSVSRLESLLQDSSRKPSQTSSAAAAAGGGGVAVAKYKPAWSERFHFAAAVRLDFEPSCAVVLPYEDLDGLIKYFAVGDSRGHVYVFSSSGDFLLDLASGVSDSPVTAMLAYLSSRRNETLLFAGHADGSIVAHRLSESAPSGDDWHALSLVSSRPFVHAPRDLDSPPVLAIELHQIARARYIIASDAGGRIRVFTENATLYGTAIATSRPLAFVKQRLLFLTESGGAGSLDLRTMVVRETECVGMNGSFAKSYTFDVLERSKAYGFTSTGDLIHVVLLGDVANLKCRVRAIRKSEVDGPVAIQAIKGYLLAVTLDKVLVYNVSSQYYGRAGSPRPLFYATIEEIKSLFLNSDALQQDVLLTVKPLIAADREKLVVLGLGGGYIGIYHPNFPVFKAQSNAVVWSGPALLFLLFLIGIWQFYVKKKDSLGWVPEESFNASTSAPVNLLGNGPGERGYVDPSRPSDLRELRGGGLRGPSRRYVSPQSRYPGGTGIGYRPSPSDPGFRGAADLKYRGQNIDSGGFPNRREPMFSSTTQVGDDHID